MCKKFEEKVLGASSKVETPVPIPNTAVKRFRANGSRKARVGQCRELFLQTKVYERTLNKGIFCTYSCR